MKLAKFKQTYNFIVLVAGAWIFVSLSQLFFFHFIFSAKKFFQRKLSLSLSRGVLNLFLSYIRSSRHRRPRRRCVQKGLLSVWCMLHFRAAKRQTLCRERRNDTGQEVYSAYIASPNTIMARESVLA